MPLPVSAKINGRLVSEGEPRHAVDLLAVGQAPVILTPRGLLREPEKVRAGDMMMVSDLSAAHAAEKFLGPIGAGAVEAVGFLGPSAGKARRLAIGAEVVKLEDI
jgi:hypothetical protein